VARSGQIDVEAARSGRIVVKAETTTMQRRGQGDGEVEVLSRRGHFI
jgi:hypothetical protein